MRMDIEEARKRAALTVPEAGELLGLSRGSAYAAVRRGEIPSIRFGNRVLVPVPRLLELLGEQPTDQRMAGQSAHSSAGEGSSAC